MIASAAWLTNPGRYEMTEEALGGQEIEIIEDYPGDPRRAYVLPTSARLARRPLRFTDDRRAALQRCGREIPPRGRGTHATITLPWATCCSGIWANCGGSSLPT